MNCEVCKRPLFEGAAACIVCGAPVPAPQAAPSAPSDPRSAAALAATQVSPAAPIYDAYAPFAPEPRPAQAPPYGPPPAPQYAPPPVPMAQMGPMNPYAQPRYMVPRHNHAATAAFICGLLGLVPFWIGFVLCIVAIVCGIIGIQYAERTPEHHGRSFAIAGLVLALVFILPAACGI